MGYHWRVFAKASRQSPTPLTHVDYWVPQYVIRQVLKLNRFMHVIVVSNTPTMQILSIDIELL
jgi:hypothetical protein